MIEWKIKGQKKEKSMPVEAELIVDGGGVLILKICGYGALGIEPDGTTFVITAGRNAWAAAGINLGPDGAMFRPA